MIGTDIYAASSAIKDMIRKGILRSLKKGSRIYEVKEPLVAGPDLPIELLHLLPILQSKGFLTNVAIREKLSMTKISTVRLLNNLVENQWLAGTGKRGKGARYTPGLRLLNQSQTIPKGGETDTIGGGSDTNEQ